MILREGNKYDNLTEEGKEQMEKIWEYERIKSVTEGGKFLDILGLSV